MAKKVVAIVGRPNVGKSTLFNVLAGEKIAIIKDVPGVTRDRIYADCQWRGTSFQIIDTGGIEPESEDIILKQMRRQSELAMDIADVIVFITDVNAGVTQSDEEVAEVMEKADELSKWASDVMAYAQAEAIENGKHWNGYKLVEGRSVRKFSDEAKVEAAAKEAGYTDIYNKSLITLTAFEKLMGKEAFAEILGQYVTKPAGKLTLVPVSDKRPEVSVNTVNDEFMED